MAFAEASLAPLDESDPDDYRPRSRWAVVADPGDAEGRVDSLCVIVEDCAPGDRIPLHEHQTDEVVILERGSVEYRLGDQTRTLEPGAIVFIPAGVVHGMRSIGDEPAHICAAFPTTSLTIRYHESNPAPGRTGITNTSMQRFDLRGP